MNADHLDLLISFILREKRFLKKRETSFTEKELKDGEQVLKRALKAIASKKLSAEEMKEVQASEPKAKRLTNEIYKRFKGLNAKQLYLLVKQYDLFYSVIEKKHKEHKVVIESLKGDRFYNPRRRIYA